MKKFILWYFLSGIFLCSTCFSLTRSEIKLQVRILIQDTTNNTNNPRFTDDTLNTMVNIVQNEIVYYTYCLYGRCLITPTTNQQEFRMPSDLIVVDRVSYLTTTAATDTYKKLIANTMSALDNDKPYWETYAAGLPTDYYERRNFIGVVPKVSGAYVKDRALKLDYYKKADDLTSDSNEPFDSDYSLRVYHDLIVKGVVIKCKKSMQKDATLDIQEYNTLLNVMKNTINYKPDNNSGSISTN